MMVPPRKLKGMRLTYFDLEISVPVRTKHAAFSHVQVVDASPANVPERLAPTRNTWRQHRIRPLPPGCASRNEIATTNLRERRMHIEFKVTL